METSHLSTIMKLLQLSSKELAASLHINVTLISKYRNQKRRLTKDLSTEISKYIVNDFCDGYTCLQSTLKDLLEPYSDKSIEAYTNEELVPLLSDYLLDDGQADKDILPEAKARAWETSIRCFAGLPGWIDVTNAFAARALKRQGSEILIGEFVYFDYEKKDNYEIYTQSSRIYMDLLNSGHKLTIITTMKEEYQSYEVLIKWLQLYAMDNIDVYYIDFNDAWDYQQSIFVEENAQVIVNLDAHRDYEKDVYVLSDDNYIVDYYYGMLREMLTYAHPLIEKIKIHHQARVRSQIEKRLIAGRAVYMLDSVPTYRNMPEEILLEVLDKNKITGNLRDEIMKSYYWWQKFYSENSIRCVFDIEETRKNLSSKKIIDYELSAITGKKIYVTEEEEKVHFKYLLYENTWKSFQIAYYPFSELELVYRYITKIAQGDTLLIMWSSMNSKNCLQYQETSYIGGCSRYLKRLWTGLPTGNRNKDCFYERVL